MNQLTASFFILWSSHGIHVLPVSHVVLLLSAILVMRVIDDICESIKQSVN